MTTVDQIMTKRVLWLAPDTTLDAAIAGLLAHGHSGAPVIENEVVIGVFSKTDALSHLSQGKEPALVRDVMTPLVFYARTSDTVISAVRLMLEEHVHRVVVVNERGHLAGLVTSIDVVRALANGTLMQAGDVTLALAAREAARGSVQP